MKNDAAQLMKGPEKSKGYFFRTAGFAFLMVLIIFLQRWDKANMVPIVFTIAGITFSTSDFFMILAAGISGLRYGIGAFVLLFASEVFVPRTTTGLSYFAMVIYLILVLLTGYFVKKRWFATWKKSLFAALLYILMLGSSLHGLMIYLRTAMADSEVVYAQLTLWKMYIGVVPEITLAVLVLHVFYRYAPDSVKASIGPGFLYTEEYQKRLEEGKIPESSVLAGRVTLAIIAMAVVISIFSVFVFDIMLHGMDSVNMPKGRDLVVMNAQMMMLIICITLPLAIGMNELVGRLLIKPVNQMTRIMERYFSQGEEERHESERILGELDIHTGDEIQELYQSLCLMVSDMSGYIDAIQREMELKKDLAEAEAESKAKSSFLSSMSHEIRTPINAVLGMDEMILREAEDEPILEYAENIRTAGNSLLGLINDILDFSKIEAGKMDIIPVEYEFASVLNDLVNMIKQRAEAKGLALYVEADEHIPRLLYGDEIRLKQIVTNILTNAVKYTEKGSVTLVARAEKLNDDYIDMFVSVKDTGIGIKQEDIQKLFSAFERIEEKRNRNVEGTGLGMNITKQLLNMMDSRLEVESVYGEGSVFSFHLKQKVVNWEPIGDFEKALKRSFANRKKYQESFIAPEARVLVVDDTKMNLTVFKGLLKQTQVQIDTATSGMECLNLMTQTAYDIIFLDHRMPEMDGIETRERMDTLEGNINQGVPVIALTANAISGAREEYLNSGFTDYLTKPIDTAALEQMMIHYLPEEKVLASEEAAGDGGKSGHLPGEATRERTGEKMGSTGVVREGAEGLAGPAGATQDGAEGLAGLAEASRGAGEQAGSTSGEGEELPVVDGLDWNYARLHLPDMEVLQTVLEEFYQVIGRQADQLDSLYEKLPGTMNEYRIQVHGMKSAAATVGIVPLAGMAKILEFAAKDENKKLIDRLHGAFITEWRSYREKMRGCFALGEDQNEEKEAYDPGVTKEKLEEIQKGMEDFDIDQADRAMEDLMKYQYPDDMQELMEKMQAAVADMDDDEVGELAEQIREMLG